ncbi:MAG TPA: M48 family metalloprotease [Xanthobacteraceae bacterium]
MTAHRTIRQRPTTPAIRVVSWLTAGAITLAGLPAQAQPDPMRGLPIVRDAEIEQLLREYTRPILRAAGLANQNIHPVIISERTFNAFVVDGRRIFVNAGALTEAQTPNQIIGVLAHEIGHIAGGHLAKMRQEMANVQTAAIIAMLLGLGAVAAAARGPGSGDAMAAAVLAPQSAALRSLLSYQRQQEEQADRAGVKFLAATGQSAKGMYETFKRFADQILFTSRYIDPYVQSHPMPKERVAALNELATNSPYWDKKDSPDLQQRHDLMRAKLRGFLERPDTVQRIYPASDQSLPARYARAISTYRFGDIRSALAQMDGLVQAQPNNPYFHELKGQALLEAGRPAEAIAPLRHAISLAPNPTLIQVMLAQALIATNESRHGGEAVSNLQNAISRDPDIPDAYTHLAMAYGRRGDLARADLASAQAAFARGDWKTARQLAARAKTRFAVGSPGWVKADDIASYKPPVVAGRR